MWVATCNLSAPSANVALCYWVEPVRMAQFTATSVNFEGAAVPKRRWLSLHATGKCTAVLQEGRAEPALYLRRERNWTRDLPLWNILKWIFSVIFTNRLNSSSLLITLKSCEKETLNRNETFYQSHWCSWFKTLQRPLNWEVKKWVARFIYQP